MTHYRITFERFDDDRPPLLLIDGTGNAESMEHTCLRIIAYLKYEEGTDDAATDADTDHERDA